MGDTTDMIKEACGVFGVRAPGQPVSHITYLGLYALQHRGQESAGIAVSDGTQTMVDKGMGLVAQVFDDHRLAALQGHVAIGHTRYSTTGASAWHNAQPVYRAAGAVTFALAHNGNLVNTADLAEQAGVTAGDIGSDSDLVLQYHLALVGVAWARRRPPRDPSMVCEDYRRSCGGRVPQRRP